MQREIDYETAQKFELDMQQRSKGIMKHGSAGARKHLATRSELKVAQPHESMSVSGGQTDLERPPNRFCLESVRVSSGLPKSLEPRERSLDHRAFQQ